MPKKRARKTREPWGRIRTLPSKRVQASYQGPDLQVHKATGTFGNMMDARAWLQAERHHIDAGTWIPPEIRNQINLDHSLAAYADTWLDERELKPRTRALYRNLLDQKILPTLGAMPLKEITTVTIKRWYASLGSSTPTRRAHAYSLLKTILASAAAEDPPLIPSNPCRIPGAGESKRVHTIEPATLAELTQIVSAMPERYRLMVLLASWCALRFGELTELRRGDIDMTSGKIRVRRGVVHVNGEAVVGPPKSAAGVRNVAVPPHLLPVIKQHLADHVLWGKQALLFPAQSGRHLAAGPFYKPWDRARRAAGRPDLRFHDLRHTGAVMAAQTGATLKELMARLGHTTQKMALDYQHAAKDRDMEIARKLSAMAEGQIS